MEKDSDMVVERWVDARLAELTPRSEWQPKVSDALARLNKRRASPRIVERRWAWVTAAVLAGYACFFAFPAPRVFAKRCVQACESFLLKGGAALAPGAFGDAPDFMLTDADGGSIRLSSYKGEVVLLNFWATWCGPCQVEIPWFSEFQRAYSDRGFAVIGVSMDDDGWRSVRPYLQKNNIAYRVGIGNQQLAEAYGGIDSLPETLIIDRDGKVVARHVGLIGKNEYESQIVRLLEKK